MQNLMAYKLIIHMTLLWVLHNIGLFPMTASSSLARGSARTPIMSAKCSSSSKSDTILSKLIASQYLESGDYTILTTQQFAKIGRSKLL